MGLETYLKDPRNSTSREILMRHRVCYDLSLAAASAEYSLQVYKPEVDREGSDIGFADGDFQFRRVQLRSVGHDSTTKKWKVLAFFVRPGPYVAERLNFEPTQGGTGEGGALVLQEYTVTPKEELEVTYYFSDAIVVSMFADGIVEKPKYSPGDQAETTRQRLQEAVTTDEIALTKPLCLQARSADALLALLGLFSRSHNHCWMNNVLAINDQREHNGDHKRRSQLARVVVAELGKLVVDPIQVGQAFR